MFAGLGPPGCPPGGWYQTIERGFDRGHTRRLTETFQHFDDGVSRRLLHKFGEHLGILDLFAAKIALGQGSQIPSDRPKRNRCRTVSTEIDLDVIELEIEVNHPTNALANHLDHSSEIMVEPTSGDVELIEWPFRGDDRVMLENGFQRGTVSVGVS